MTTAIAPSPSRTNSAASAGLAIALLSAATFGFAGSLGSSLLQAGWSPGAVVLIRIGGAALVMMIPCVLVARHWRPTRGASARLVTYGVVAVAGAQFCFFSAVQYLPVGVALLLEYLAPVLLIGWTWFRTRRQPSRGVVLGAAVAVAGMALVLDVLGDFRLNPIGVFWGLGAAVCLAFYFVLSDSHSDAAPALVTTGVGTAVGALVIGLAGLVGLIPMRFSSADATLAGLTVPWLVPAALLVLISTVAAYVSGIVAVRRLGSHLASFVGLTEVLFAVVFAALLVSQAPGLWQIIGGALVITGIAVVQRGSGPSSAPEGADQ